MPRGRVIVVALAGVLAGACDRSAETARCQPGAAAQRDCIEAEFAITNDLWRDVAGTVRRGQQPVTGAVVQVWSSRDGVLATSGLTNGAGVFGPLHYAPFRYDLAVRAQDDVIVYRGAAYRNIEPSFDTGTIDFETAWKAPIDVQLDVPLAANMRLAFFATGDRALGIAGDMEHGVYLVGRDYVTAGTIHAVAYATDGDLATATAYGKTDVFAAPNAPALARIHLDPITDARETKLAVEAPLGFTVDDTIEVLLGYSSSSFAHLTRMRPGVTTRIPVVPGGGYTFRARATSADGATTESGEAFLDINNPDGKVTLVAPPVAVSPADGAAAGSTLEARGTGVCEHVLDPVSGGPTVRLVSRDDVTPIPDVTRLALPALHGAYRWTVHLYPSVTTLEFFGGLYPRRYTANSAAAPRTIVF